MRGPGYAARVFRGEVPAEDLDEDGLGACEAVAARTREIVSAVYVGREVPVWIDVNSVVLGHMRAVFVRNAFPLNEGEGGKHGFRFERTAGRIDGVHAPWSSARRESASETALMLSTEWLRYVAQRVARGHAHESIVVPGWASVPTAPVPARSRDDLRAGARPVPEHLVIPAWWVLVPTPGLPTLHAFGTPLQVEAYERRVNGELGTGFYAAEPLSSSLAEVFDADGTPGSLDLTKGEGAPGEER